MGGKKLFFSPRHLILLTSSPRHLPLKQLSKPRSFSAFAAAEALGISEEEQEQEQAKVKISASPLFP